MGKYRVLELYSGIGGMHLALQEAGVDFEVVAAADINTTANAIYRRNFPHCNVVQRNIEGFTAAEMDRLQIDVIVMSPPCQPFTRLGQQKDVLDTRCASFLHVLSAVQRMRRPPRFLLLENVCGFEKSRSRELLLDALGCLRLEYREILLTPSQLQLPNARLRYYLIARTQPFSFPQSDDQPMRELPVCVCPSQTDGLHCVGCNKPVSAELRGRLQTSEAIESAAPPTISEFLSAVREDDESHLLLADSLLIRYSELLDLVYPHSRRSCCFTKGYGHRVEGTGSVLVPEASEEQVAAAYETARQLPVGDPRRASALAPLRIRYFSPREVAALMCFPDWYSGGEAVTRQQMYRVLGNSVNVRVVSVMLIVLFHDSV